MCSTKLIPRYADCAVQCSSVLASAANTMSHANQVCSLTKSTLHECCSTCQSAYMTLCRVLPTCLCATVHQLQEEELVYFAVETMLPFGAAYAPKAAPLVGTRPLERYTYVAI